MFDFLIQLIDIIDPDPAGVDDFEVATGVFQHVAHSVAGHTGDFVDNRQSQSSQPIENTRLADIRPADNGNLGKRHGSNQGKTGQGKSVLRQLFPANSSRSSRANSGPGKKRVAPLPAPHRLVN